jgi:hypothetical protein
VTAAIRARAAKATTPGSLTGWTPIALDWDGTRPVIRWCFTDGVEFIDPLFDQTIDRCLRDPFRLLFWRETGIDALAELAALSPGPEPAGLIFHMSRCGSTLLAQMFAGLSATLVISEAGPIDAVLRPRPGRSDEDAVEWLRWMVSALGRRSGAEQRRLVVKLDAWAILQLPLIRRAFPETPCVFVYRDPVEVLVSHLGRRGYHAIPGTLPPDWFGLTLREARSLTPERYIAAVLAGLCRPAIAAARDRKLTLVQYEQLAESAATTVAPLFGVDVGRRERAVLAAVAERDAKNPVIPFVADAVDKQRRATAEARAAVAASFGQLYGALENLRRGQS